MNRMNKIVVFLFACLAFVSCMDETGMEQTKIEVKDGLPVTVQLDFQPSEATRITKAEMTEAEEHAFKDLYVFIFNENGTLDAKQYFTEDELIAFGKQNGQGRVSLRATSGTKRVMAIANIQASNFALSADKDEVNNPKDLKRRIDRFFENPSNGLTQWMNFSAEMTKDDTSWAGGHFLMSGMYNKERPENFDAMGTGVCLFHADGKVTDTAGAGGGKIWLVKTVAFVKFEISTADDVSFELEEWQIHHVPQQVHLFKNKGVYTEQVFEPGSDFMGSFANNSFDFYMLESLRPTGSGLDVQSREKVTDNSTYIVIKGKYKGPGENRFLEDKSDWMQTATGTVTYKIHLGYVPGPNDFTVNRNYKYTYKVKITGVNEIIVEAFEDKDSPRSSGDLMFAGGELIEVDCHFSRLLLNFPAGSQLVSDHKPGIPIPCAVKTAKTGWKTGDVEVFKADGSLNPAADIDWVYFVEKSMADALWAKGGKGPDFEAYRAMSDEDKAQSYIMTIYDLAMALNANQTYYNTGVDVYAYVFDNYYDTKDVDLADFVNYERRSLSDKSRTMKIALMSTGSDSRVSSARYVISQKPLVTIFDPTHGGGWAFECINENLPPKYHTSTDYSYKANYAGLYYKKSGTIWGPNDDNGWRNTYWYDADKTQQSATDPSITGGDVYDGAGKKVPYVLNRANNLSLAYADLACLSRNVDLNGDGKITGDERIWYLPGIDQYQHYWVGWDAIPAEVTLYPEEFRSYFTTHPDKVRETFSFYSSGGKRFQADEGSAVREDSDHNRRYRLHIRCARNLGSIDGTNKVSIAETAPSGSNDSFLIEVTGLPARSLRGKVDGKQVSHDEYSGLNALYNTLEVKRKLIGPTSPGNLHAQWSTTGAALPYRAINEHINKEGNNPCEKLYGRGWRPANQRELIAIRTIGSNEIYVPINADPENEYAQTMSSMWNFFNAWTAKAEKREIGVTVSNTEEVITSAKPRWGYAYRGKELHLPYDTHNFDVRVRCVRDI
ncbi:fimbrial protein [Parabacteroides sp. PF5-6]|uniref:fimbrial protein n=1 Tax=Parabacteroides sp. PF5-6 TaxID=1742403 RepID=UPI0024075087|nr:fimbrial protein [Parabacteroides sp. PF5-6]MDF9829908.1 hypothetical protein [Parabacteroides sp. PF5-6]